MSIFELLVIFFVALIFLDKSDIKFLLQKARKTYDLFLKSKKDLIDALELNDELDAVEESKEELEEINFYLSKIIEIQGSYSGEYDLGAIKKGIILCVENL